MNCALCRVAMKIDDITSVLNDEEMPLEVIGPFLRYLLYAYVDPNSKGGDTDTHAQGVMNEM